jgi:hypothetical protein
MADLRRQRVLLAQIASAAALNSLLFKFVPDSAGVASDILFNALRLSIAALGGWLLVKRAHSSLRVVALAGVLALLADHVLIKGGWFVVEELLFPSPGDRTGFLAFAGVLISFVMFAPLFAFCSWFAGRAAVPKRFEHNEP